MSPRAAWRLESLGFERVYDYVAGKADWLSNGLPREGTAAATARAGDLLRADMPTCGLHDRAGPVRAQIEEGAYDFCLVVNEHKILLGRLRRASLHADPTASIEEVMEAGPSTIRPNRPLDALLSSGRAPMFVITTPHGRLLGVLSRGDAERAHRSAASAA